MSAIGVADQPEVGKIPDAEAVCLSASAALWQGRCHATCISLPSMGRWWFVISVSSWDQRA